MPTEGFVGEETSYPPNVMDERGTEAESRELAAGVDGNSGVGAGLEKTATRRRGKARRKTRLFAIRTGFVTRAGT
jgi:hypothetical protein